MLSKTHYLFSFLYFEAFDNDQNREMKSESGFSLVMASQIFVEIKFVKEMKACDILAMVMFKLLTHGPTFF